MEKRKRIKNKAIQDREENSHPTIQNEQPAKVVVVDNYWNYDSMRQIPITNATMTRLVENGIKWARENDDAIKVNQFLDKNGIPRFTWDRWREKHEIIRDGHNQMMTILGNRREHGLITRKFEAGSTERMMPLYDQEWRQMAEWKSSLTNKDSLNSGNAVYNIHMHPVTSDIKPRKKREDEIKEGAL